MDHLLIELGEQVDAGEVGGERARAVALVDTFLELGEVIFLEHPAERRGTDQQANRFGLRGYIGGDRIARQRAHLAEQLAGLEEDGFPGGDRHRHVGEFDRVASQLGGRRRATALENPSQHRDNPSLTRRLVRLRRRFATTQATQAYLDHALGDVVGGIAVLAHAQDGVARLEGLLGDVRLQLGQHPIFDLGKERILTQSLDRSRLVEREVGADVGRVLTLPSPEAAFLSVAHRPSDGGWRSASSASAMTSCWSRRRAASAPL